MVILNDIDWDWIGPEQAARSEQTSDVLGGRPRIAGSRISIAQVLDWVRRNGWAGAIEQIRSCQPSLSEADAEADVEAALAFAAAIMDRPLPDSLTRSRPEWSDKIKGWD